MAKIFEARAIIEAMVPSPWDRDTFIASLSQYRGRPIELRGVRSSDAAELYGDLSSSPCGVWCDCTDKDIILYDQGMTERHLIQVLCHEAAHMVLGHSSDVEPNNDWLQLLLADVDPAAVRSALGRDVVPSEQESEAELLADLVMTKVSHFRNSPAMRSLWGSA
ncbi:hypothetical protein HQO83_07170 [Rhodococcus fascians]|nr:hypothetical protein [Rhodococcus fascians]